MEFKETLEMLLQVKPEPHQPKSPPKKKATKNQKPPRKVAKGKNGS